MPIPNQLSGPDLIKFVSDGFDSAKAGNALSVYTSILPYYEEGLLDKKSHYAFGWIIYYALHQAQKYDIAERKKMLARYLNLSTPRPHKLHSMILTEAIRLAKDAEEAAYALKKKEQTNESKSKPMTFSIVRFTALWNLAYLREGDWRRKENDGKMLNSTVERLITCYVNELEQNQAKPLPVFEKIFSEALTKFSDSSSIHSQAATLYLLSDKTPEAIESLRKALLLTPTKFFLWSRLAGLLCRKEDVKLRISMLYKALSLPGQEDFKGKVRLALAKAWISIKAYGQAKFELEAMRSLYEKNGWHLSSSFMEAMKELPAETKPVNPLAVYKRIAYMADEFLVESIEEIPVVKTYHKPATENVDKYGKKRMQPVAWRVTDQNRNNYWFTPSRFGIDETLGSETRLKVKVHEGKVVGARVDSSISQ